MNRKFVVLGDTAAKSREEHPAGIQRRYGIMISGNLTKDQKIALERYGYKGGVVDTTGWKTTKKDQVTRLLVDWGISFSESNL